MVVKVGKGIALKILLVFYTKRNLPSLPNIGGFATRALMQEDRAYESADYV